MRATARMAIGVLGILLMVVSLALGSVWSVALATYGAPDSPETVLWLVGGGLAWALAATSGGALVGYAWCR